MKLLQTPRCRIVRSWITAAHDGELSCERQVALDAHLARCAACRQARDELATMRIALRFGAAEHRPDDGAFARLAPEVMARTTLEQQATWPRRVREAVDDGHRLWIMGGAMAATMVVTMLVAFVLSLATPMHPRSIAGLMQTSIGSNTNPLWLATGVSVPHMAGDTPLDTRAAAMLLQPLPPLVLENLALTAIVTREGLLASVAVLHDEVNDAPDAALTRLPSCRRYSSGRRQ